jgi:hypothetical protein
MNILQTKIETKKNSRIISSGGKYFEFKQEKNKAR